MNERDRYEEGLAIRRAVLGAAHVDRALAQRQFRADVRKHVDDIAKKYIVPDETADGAVMFVPAEAVFAEMFGRGLVHGSPSARAAHARMPYRHLGLGFQGAALSCPDATPVRHPGRLGAAGRVSRATGGGQGRPPPMCSIRLRAGCRSRAASSDR